MITSDRTEPIIKIEAIRNGEYVKDQLREAIKFMRDKKGVRETDFE